MKNKYTSKIRHRIVYTEVALIFTLAGMLTGVQLGAHYFSPRSAYKENINNDESPDLVVTTRNGSKYPLIAVEGGAYHTPEGIEASQREELERRQPDLRTSIEGKLESEGRKENDRWRW